MTDWTVPAPNMADRADEFRRSFLTTYWTPTPRPPYPLAAELAKLSVRPISLDAWELLMLRQTGLFEGDVIVSSGPETFAPFDIQAGGQTIGIDLSLPAELRLAVKVGAGASTLTFSPTPPLAVQLRDAPIQDGVPLPIGTSQSLLSVEVGTDALRYALRDVDTASSWAMVFVLRPQTLFGRVGALLGRSSKDDNCLPKGRYCTKCTCFEWRSDNDTPEHCLNIRVPTKELCGHLRSDHNV